MKKTTRPVFQPPNPHITTARLLIRPYEATDLDDLHVMRRQYEVMRWTSQGTVDVDKKATRKWMDRFLPPNDAILFNFVIEELSHPGVVIGAVGCHTMSPPECGYMLRTEYWGKGYATEALGGWLQAYWGLPRKEVVMEDTASEHSDDAEITFVPEVMMAYFEERNKPSSRVLVKSGFRYVSEQIVEDHGEKINLIIFELGRPHSM